MLRDKWNIGLRAEPTPISDRAPFDSWAISELCGLWKSLHFSELQTWCMSPRLTESLQSLNGHMAWHSAYLSFYCSSGLVCSPCSYHPELGTFLRRPRHQLLLLCPAEDLSLLPCPLTQPLLWASPAWSQDHTLLPWTPVCDFCS